MQGVLQNDKEVSEAVYDIGKDTLDGAVSGYLIGAGDTAIRGVMNSSSNSVFGKFVKNKFTCNDSDNNCTSWEVSY